MNLNDTVLWSFYFLLEMLEIGRLYSPLQLYLRQVGIL